MPDIKLTLSKWKEIGRENAYMQQQQGLSYPLPYRPRRAAPGCRVYFILRNELAARCTVMPNGFAELRQIQQMLDYKGNDIWRPGWWVKCFNMELQNAPIPSPGFQGFRYVTDAERPAFEAAFP